MLQDIFNKIDILRKEYNDWKDSDPEYAEICQNALKKLLEKLENILHD